MNHLHTNQIERLLQFSFLSEEERELATLLLAVGRGEVTWANVLAQLEIQEGLSVVYLSILEALRTYFNSEVTVLDREVQLRLWMVLLHKMGKYWSIYRTEKREEGVLSFDDYVLKVQASKEEEIEKLTWFQLLHHLIATKDEIRNIGASNLIQEGMKQEIGMIIEMIAPQTRTRFAADQQWETETLVLRKIEEEDRVLLQSHFTPAIGQYLSIESFAHPALVKAYIQQSQEEMKQGTCLVLMAFERESQQFVGCLTLNDINQYSTEIGLWVREQQQQKGYGSALLDLAVSIVEQAIPTQQIIYTVEKENTASIVLCEKKGFQLERELILEPTPLKNKYREMLRYTRRVFKAN